MTRPRPTNPYDLHDPRQRLAIALLTAAVRLPAEMDLCAKLFLEAARIKPGLNVRQAYFGDRAGALIAVKAIVEDLIDNPGPADSREDG